MNAILKFRVLFILFLSVLAGCGIIDMEWNVSEYLYGKPRYQELTIGYHYLGWDPKRERFFFIKTLTEYRDFKWEAEESRYEWHWYPEATNVQYIVCAVSEAGTNLKELYALPQNQLRRLEARLDELIRRFKNSSPVLSDGSIIQLIGDNFIRISARGVEELAKVSAGVSPQIEASPSDKNVLIVSRFNTDRSENGMYIANLETGGLDHFPIPEIIDARWSPDGKRVVIVAGNVRTSPAVRRIEVFDLLQKSRKTIFEVKLPGADGPTFEWTHDNTIWLPMRDTKKPEISSDIFTVKETPELWESNIGEKKYFTGQPVKELRQISLGVSDYQPVYVARMGPPRVFGLVTEWPYETNAVRILRAKQEEQKEKAVSEYETIFSLPNKKIHVSEKQSWDDAIKAESDSSGALW